MFARVTLLYLLALVLSAPLRADVYLTEEQALKLAFPAADCIEKQLVALTRDERAAIEKSLGPDTAPRTFKYWIGKHGQTVVGYAVIDDVLGKDQPITYMVSVDEKLSIRSVEILAYREARGGEVRRADWRAQFEGKTAGSKLRVGSDVRNIAGATISCRSVTDGVRRQLVCLSVLAKPTATTGTREPARGTAQDAAGRTNDADREKSNRDPPPASPLSTPSVLVSRNQLLMGTTLVIRAYVANGETGLSLLEPAFAEVARLEAIFSTWRAESEVSRLDRSAGGDRQPASPELLELCAKSVEVSERTQGVFDVTAGPSIELWKNAARRGVAPGPAEIQRAREHVGFAGIELDRALGTVRLARAGMVLDFGGIAKGYALDRAAAKLEEAGIHSALLDFGGQLLALDPPPGQSAWPVEVRDPERPERSSTRIRLVRASVSTTADYERGMKIGSRPISHIVDPRSGLPVEDMLGTSVVTPTAVEADALSTALYVFGFDAAVRYAEAHDLRASIAAPGGRTARTKGFQALEIVDDVPR